MTILSWFTATAAEDFGKTLADKFAQSIFKHLGSENTEVAQSIRVEVLQNILSKERKEVDDLRLNFYQKAKFANSFKWRLLEKGVGKETADDVTQALLLRISVKTSSPSGQSLRDADRPKFPNAKSLLAHASKAIAGKDFSEAASLYQDLLDINPRHAVGLNNLGSMLIRLGRYKEAEDRFRQAIQIQSNYPDAHANLGTLLRWRGQMLAAETELRLALKIKPNFLEARVSLGLTQILSGKLRDARAKFEKVLKTSRSNPDALLGMGQIARIEGRFADAEAFFNKALVASPKMPSAWASLTSLRKMTLADTAWLEGASKVLDDNLTPLESADVLFAVGKYYDDVNQFEPAFQNYKRGNELLKSVADVYDGESRTSFVDHVISTYSTESIEAAKKHGSNSKRPIFIVGMMRSGTSLVEQIIASHPTVSGAGEFDFWNESAKVHETNLSVGPPTGLLNLNLAESYLQVLNNFSTTAVQVIDKTPFNSDHLGTIHSVFPNAKMIYMQRDPIDTCLSCYFQQFSPALNFAMDMSDLAHYYREHHRLMAHWRNVLPQGSILDVPYAALVTDQEKWTRRILDFLELEWDERVMDFYKTKRPVLTASSWQVRQKIYGHSVDRWRNYEKFIKPLVTLKDLAD